METCFSKVTKRPAGIYQADLTPQLACRLTDFPFPFISGCSSIQQGQDWGRTLLFFYIIVIIINFFARPNFERFFPRRGGLACALALPHIKGPRKAIGDLFGGCSNFSSLSFLTHPISPLHLHQKINLG